MQLQAASAKGWKDMSLVFSEKSRSSVDSDSALSSTDEGLTSRDVTGYGSRLDGTCPSVVPLLLYWPLACSGVVRIDPLRFLAGCRTRRLNQV